MTSLSDVYGGEVRTVAGRRRRAAGTTLFVVGVAMVAVAILVATTGLREWLSLDLFAARELAGVLAGLGLPAAILGVFVVLPARPATRSVASIGAGIALVGVGLFRFAYPQQWISSAPTLALATTAVYALGTLVTFWCLFVAIATFKTRNDPGGTARLRVTEEGRIRLLSAPRSVAKTGSVGLFGRGPDGDVPTQTGDGDDGLIIHEPTSDGGRATADDPAGDAMVEAAAGRGMPDPYCGNCEHFQYASVGDSLDPYCTYHEELMDDMDACEQWTSNT